MGGGGASETKGYKSSSKQGPISGAYAKSTHELPPNCDALRCLRAMLRSCEKASATVRALQS